MRLKFKLYGYWHTILPGSNVNLGESGMVGNNTDVRHRAPMKKWRGGIAGTGRGGGNSRDPVGASDSRCWTGFLPGRREFVGRTPERPVRADLATPKLT